MRERVERRRRHARRSAPPRPAPGVEVVLAVIRLLLADDQALVRGALAALLDLETDLEVVAQVGRGDEVVDAARALGRRGVPARHRDARASTASTPPPP